MRFFILMILLVSFKLQSQPILFSPFLDNQIDIHKEKPYKAQGVWKMMKETDREESRSNLAINAHSFEKGKRSESLDKDKPETGFSNLNDIDLAAILISIFVIEMIVILIILYIQRYKMKMIEKYEEIIHKAGNNNERSSKLKVSITDDTLNQILEKLKDFEQGNEFTRKDTSLPKLSHQLNTNTTYLSEVIKQYKKNNFNGYINHLRIEYIIRKLHEDPMFREYKISYLAEEAGFASREVFAITFKKERGISPSHFIKELKDSQK